MGEDRVFAGGTSGAAAATAVLAAKALEATAVFEWAAVARIAFRRSMLFCCRLGTSIFCFVGGISFAPASFATDPPSSSGDDRFLTPPS